MILLKLTTQQASRALVNGRDGTEVPNRPCFGPTFFPGAHSPSKTRQPIASKTTASCWTDGTLQLGIAVVFRLSRLALPSRDTRGLNNNPLDCGGPRNPGNNRARAPVAPPDPLALRTKAGPRGDHTLAPGKGTPEPADDHNKCKCPWLSLSLLKSRLRLC